MALDEVEQPLRVPPILGVHGDDATVAARLSNQVASVDEVVCLFGTPDGDEVVWLMERFARGVMPLANSATAADGFRRVEPWQLVPVDAPY